jgi:hypothetical protein
MVIGTFEAAASVVEVEFEFELATEFVTEVAFTLLTGADVFEFGVVGVHPTSPSERMNTNKPVFFERAQLFLVRI